MNTMMNPMMMNQMMNTAYQQQPQQQMYGGTPEKQSNPFWYRENSGYLVGVTNAPSNPMLGIENIILNPRTGNQPATLLANGRLATMIGQVTFQVFASTKNGAPYVSTISVKNNNNTYFEHILLKPQVKAQILRFYEAWSTSTGTMMTQQPMPQMNVGFGMPQQQMQVPQPQQAVQQPQQMQPDMVQMMMAQMQQMQQQMAQMTAGVVPQESTPTEGNQTEAVASEGTPATEDELPI